MLTFMISMLIRLRRWLRYRRNLQVLALLDDRTLSDIGIARSDVPRAAWRGRYY